MIFPLDATGMPLQDMVIGASVYFPPLFKAFALGFILWLFLHHLLRDHIYSGEIWHPILMDLSIFVLCVGCGFVILVVWK